MLRSKDLRFVAGLSALLASLVPASVAFAVDEAPKPPEAEKDKDKGPFEGLKFRSIGPAIGGRVARVAGVPGQPLVYYAATAQGGVWKSEDGGLRWKALFDDQPILSTGSIAVAPSDPNVIYVGTGEANIRGNVQPGIGIFRSTDAGKSWTHVWKQTGQIGQIVVHPQNPDVAWAAVLGHAFGPNAERGVYKTVDGGATWKQVLYKDADTGASSVAIDPSNPRLVYAAIWHAQRHPHALVSGGEDSGIWRSTDGGDHWEQVKEHGLPDGLVGKVGLAVAPSEPARVYALLESEKGGLFRSDDHGESWKLVNDHHALRQRAWYYSTLTVDPKNPDRIWFPQVPLLHSIDGGKTIQSLDGYSHGDVHDAWVDPNDGDRVIIGHDGGIDVTLDGGATWYAPKLAWGQFYNVDVSDQVPYRVGGTIQDQGTASGPSNSLRSEGILLADWTGAGGGESGDFAFDRKSPGRIYAGEYGGIMTRYEGASGNERNVSYYPTNPSGHGAEDLRVRFQWTAPLLASRKEPGTIYHGANVLMKSTDGGQSWTAVSPDLTRNDKEKQKWSGGPITGDNTGVEVYDTIFSLAESPFDAAEIWAGSDDGLLHVTRDGGASWSNVTPPGLREWATIESIGLSPHERGTAWVAVDGHRLDDNHPYVYRTRDGGASWEMTVAGIPDDHYALAVREDPSRPGLLYLGTRAGLFLSFDGGDRWERLKAGLPPVAVTDLEPHQGDLVVATSGRALWILDDLSPLRAWSSAIAPEDVKLFDSRPARRWLRQGSWSEEGAFENPPNGATIHYWLGKKVEGDMTLEIFDAAGRRVRKMSSVAKPQLYAEDDPDEPTKKPEPELDVDKGLHRVVWNLRWDGATRIADAKIDSGDTDQAPRAVPGKYRLKLTAGGKSVESSVEVLPDPRSTATQADLEAQLAFVLEIRDALNRVAGDVETVRAIRAQASELATRLTGDARGTDLVPVAKRLAEQAEALENELHNPKAKVVYDILAQRGGTQLHSNLVFLYAWALNGDGAPTQGEREVFAENEKRIGELEAKLAEIRSGNLAELERQADALKLPHVLLKQPIESEDL